MVTINNTAGRALGVIFSAMALVGCEDRNCPSNDAGRDVTYKTQGLSTTFHFTQRANEGAGLEAIDSFRHADIMSRPTVKKTIKNWCATGVVPDVGRSVHQPLFWSQK